MKSLLIVIALSASSAWAFTSTEVAQLPVLQNVKIVVSTPSPLTPVQPTGYVEFEFTSCTPAQFEAEVQKENGVLFIQLKDVAEMDCHGPRRARDYSVQYSSDALATEKVLVLNPQSALSPFSN